jgi:drug/metabolite transporter (DMT)-like permease
MIVSTKRLTRNETILGILFWMTAMQCVIGLIATGWDGDIAWPSRDAWPWITVLGVGGLAAHTCLTNALKIAPAAVVVPLDFLRLPAIAVIGMLFYAEALSIWVFLGALLIFGGNYINILSETRNKT